MHISTLESAIGHDSTGELCIEVLLVSHTGPELLLPEHLPKRDIVVIRVYPDHLACLGITLLNLRRS